MGHGLLEDHKYSELVSAILKSKGVEVYEQANKPHPASDACGVRFFNYGLVVACFSAEVIYSPALAGWDRNWPLR